MPGPVILDSAGNLYGTASLGGAANKGVFKLDSTGHETVLYNFTGGTDGSLPNGVVRNPSGNLYGTTMSGGTADLGVAFKLNPSGNETVLHSFTGGTDGSTPLAGLIIDSVGNLYGTTSTGGNKHGGVVFGLKP